MKPIIATITPGDTGPQVVNLQDALLALLEHSEHKIIRPFNEPDHPTLEELNQLTEGLKTERAQLMFGEATGQLVMHFQVQQSLGDDLRGVVEDTTAAKLNKWLKKLGLLDDPDSTGFVVHGSVNTSDDQPIQGALVRAFDRDMRKEQELGAATTDDHGQYIIRYDSYKFAAGDVPSAPAPKLIVRASPMTSRSARTLAVQSLRTTKSLTSKYQHRRCPNGKSYVLASYRSLRGKVRMASRCLRGSSMTVTWTSSRKRPN